MATKSFVLPGIGEVTIYKRRKTTNLRLSVNSKGKVRVTVPYWAPYTAGINFARTKQDWLESQLKKHADEVFEHGQGIGKSHRLKIVRDESAKSVKARLGANQLTIISPYAANHPATQAKIRQAATKALKKEAETLLPQRLAYLAKKGNFTYKAVKVRSLTSRWGSCASDGTITLSYYLIQLPWHHIDYVLVHELIHTIHMNHGANFWNTFDKHLSGAKQIRKQMNAYKPGVWAVST
jgi:predicted metal-dependent hydrolase